MGRSDQDKEKRIKGDELSLDDVNEGGAARTRPLSFDEIMIRRKNKNLSETVKGNDVQVGNLPVDLTIDNAFDDHESGRHHKHHKVSSPGCGMHISDTAKKDDYILKKNGGSSRWNYEGSHEETKLKEDYVAKSNHRRTLKSEIRLKDRSPVEEKDRGSCGSEINLKAKSTKNTTSKVGKSEKSISSQGRSRDRSMVDPRAEATKKDLRDISGKDTLATRTGDKSERESKRKHRNADDEKTRDKTAAKKVDLGKSRDLNVSEREEKRRSPKSRHGESSLKKRRSRSRELDNRNRRSISFSPRAVKRTSFYDRDHEELPSHSTKSRSARQHSDTDRSRVNSNGSSAHYRRHGGSKSGLGGYSPRKRRSEAAIKTPSPIDRSPEKKSARWDVAPEETYSIPSNVQTSEQTLSLTANKVVRLDPVTSTTSKPLTGTSVGASLAKLNVSVDSVQLTQANRPMRRLCIENVPVSASEKVLMEFLNNLLMSSGVHHIHGSLPCISCAIQKENGQALVEFLTADDASAALSCDGCSFSGSVLKFRRPKEFVEVASGEAEKSVASVDSISSVVNDSLHKIFIGGISKTISSEMVMAIACAFGPLRAYHFEINGNYEEPCAFLEYVDQSVTPKAIAGLNGMKLGGQVLTAVQAILDGSSMDNSGNRPFYGIPEHALPLLKKPTEVLMLRNLFNPEGFSSLSELEVEEVLEDVRIECARFGTVKSVNVIKQGDGLKNTAESCEGNENTVPAGVGKNLMGDGTCKKGESVEEVTYQQSVKNNGLEFPSVSNEVKESREGNNDKDDMPAGDTMRDNASQLGKLDTDGAAEDQCHDSTLNAVSQVPDQLNSSKDEASTHDDQVTCNIQMGDRENKSSAKEESNLEEVVRNSAEAFAGAASDAEMQSNAVQNGDIENQDTDLHAFEPGFVFVEYRRKEASCTAAHSLHRRLFDDRVVTVDYVPLDLYRARFPK